MGKYQAYPEYKDSSSKLLGRIPEQWVATKIKYVGFLRGGAGFPHIEQGVSGELLDFHKVNALGRADEKGFLGASENTISLETAKRLGAYVFPTGSIVFAKVGAALLLARIRSLKADACIDNNMMGLVVHRKHDSSFIRYAMNIVKFDYIVNPGAVPSLNEFQMGNLFLAVPELSTQKKIIQFLDHETAKIDTLIDKQQQLIQLLKEKRQAVISHAVTKGLNPNAPMRDSGVEWLGEVPEHWKVGRYKFCTSRVVVGIAEAATHAYAETGVPIIRSTNIREEGLDLSGMLFIKKGFAELNSSKYLYTNDVITVRTGYPGTSAVIPETLDKSQCFTNLVATPKEEMSPHFLSEYLNSHTGKSYFDLLGWGSAQKNISVPILQNISIAWPEISEQKEIVSYIQQQREQYTKLVTKGEKQIELLQERRTALISAAVTGKIDVRHHVSRPTGNDTSEVSA